MRAWHKLPRHRCHHGVHRVVHNSTSTKNNLFEKTLGQPPSSEPDPHWLPVPEPVDKFALYKPLRVPNIAICVTTPNPIPVCQMTTTQQVPDNPELVYLLHTVEPAKSASNMKIVHKDHNNNHGLNTINLHRTEMDGRYL
eukprot:Selendium_serpulae@DN6509_c4_g4_i1.p2